MGGASGVANGAVELSHHATAHLGAKSSVAVATRELPADIQTETTKRHRYYPKKTEFICISLKTCIQLGVLSTYIGFCTN
jgi:hypothetical protein